MIPTATHQRGAAAPTRRALLAAAAVLPAAPARGGYDAAWPSRPVRFVTLGAPGAGIDAVARALAEALARRWGQPVVVDNRPGGEGIVSIEAFLAARDGGHTLLFNPIGTWTALPLLHEGLSFEPARDMVPLAFVVQDFLALAAAPALGAATLSEVVEAARARPGRLTYAYAPSVPFLAFTAFQKEAEVSLTYVLYRNPVASLADLAQGRVDLALLPLSPMVGPARGGQLRLVAMASPDRAPLAPEVPTAAEAGFPALSFPGGHGLFAPKEMPGNLRARVAGAVREAVAEPETARRLAVLGYVPRAGTPADFEALLEGERARWAEVARRHGAKPPR